MTVNVVFLLFVPPQNCTQCAVSYPVMLNTENYQSHLATRQCCLPTPSAKSKSKMAAFLWHFCPREDDKKVLQLHVILTDPLSLALVRGWFQTTANRGVSASHIRFDLGLWLKRSLLESRCAQRSTCHLDIAFLVAKTYKWEHEILLKLAMPARPAGSPHHAQLELI